MSSYAVPATTRPRLEVSLRGISATPSLVMLPGYPSADANADFSRSPGAPPPVIPVGQEYYWTEEWQAGERETLAELAAGRGRTFDTAMDALRYLFSADDD